MSIISKLKATLDNSTYERENPDEVIQTFQRLSVKVSKDVEKFFCILQDHFGKKHWVWNFLI